MKIKLQNMLRTILMTSILFLISTQCKKESTAVTFFTEANAKPILDKCAKCHATNQSASGKWTYDPTNYEISIKQNIETIHSLTKNFGGGMASTAYANLSQAEVDALNKWYVAGYPSGSSSSSSSSGSYGY